MPPLNRCLRNLLCAVILVAPALSQTVTDTVTLRTSTGGNLVSLVPQVYGPNGLVLPNPFHSAHFTNEVQENFTPVNTSVGTQLSLLPIVSPASGYVYTFDKALGVMTQSNSSFGPVLAERAETVGRHKLFVGFTFQRFAFSTIDGQDIHNFPATFGHILCCGSPAVATFEQDFITTKNNIDLSINQFTSFATFGLTNRVDISVAVPVVHASMAVTSDATIHRLENPASSGVFFPAHYFDPNNQLTSLTKTFKSSSDATGVGDVTFRIKGTAWKGERAALAFGLDVRAPSGDELNFLGSGGPGVKPFIAASYKARFSPHVNIGYDWNGDSVLAGNPSTGTKGDLPDAFFYSGGVDVGVHKRLSLAFDFLGQHVIDAQRLTRSTFTPFSGAAVPQSTFTTDSLEIINGAAGVKFSPGSNFLVTANLLFRMNSAGLRADVVPLVGLSYTF